jgi:2'-5' RNA ligase
VWAVEIYLDPASEERVRSIWAAIDAEGVVSLGSVPGTKYRPHVSLAVFEDADLTSVGDALVPETQAFVGMPLTLASLGFFVGPSLFAFLGVTPTERLLDVHRQLHAALDGVAHRVWSDYEPGAFVPHCTLAMGPQDVAPIVRALGSDRIPIDAIAHEVHLVEISTGRSRSQLA